MAEPIRCEDVVSHPEFRRLSTIRGIAVDLRYASVRNFVGRDLYGALDCAWLHRQAAAGLEQAVAHHRQPDGVLERIVVVRERLLRVERRVEVGARTRIPVARRGS